jgi:hypothetical protein
MEIIIGAATKMQTAMSKSETGGGSLVEARMLKVRPARRGGELAPPGDEDRRTIQNAQDPSSGRILTLLVPDDASLPKDVQSGDYRVFLRFAKRG